MVVKLAAKVTSVTATRRRNEATFHRFCSLSAAAFCSAANLRAASPEPQPRLSAYFALDSWPNLRYT